MFVLKVKTYSTTLECLPLSHMHTPDKSSGKVENTGANSAVEIKSTRKCFFAERSGIAWITAERQNAGTIWQA